MRKDYSQDTIPIIAGSGRSGTTWLLDALSEANRRRPVFEPLKPVYRSIPLRECFYLTAEDRDEQLFEFFEQVFSGKYNSIWTDYRVLPIKLCPRVGYFTSPVALKKYLHRFKTLLESRNQYSDLVKNTPVLVKFIRANLMLGWISENFPVSIAFVVRHPGAVVESQYRLSGQSWDPFLRLARYTNNDGFQKHLYERYGSLLGGKLSVVEANTVLWCIENQHPIESASARGYKVFYYEQLQHGDIATWKDLVGHLGLTEIPDSNLLSEPSQQASRAYINGAGSPKEPGWVRRLDRRSKDEIQRVLDRVGFNLYSLEHSDPLI